jgi:hypothetical protein
VARCGIRFGEDGMSGREEKWKAGRWESGKELFGPLGATLAYTRMRAVSRVNSCVSGSGAEQLNVSSKVHVRKTLLLSLFDYRSADLILVVVWVSEAHRRPRHQ